MLKKIFKRKKAQEEMIGFAIIIIVVAAVILLLLYFSIDSGEESMESYKAESFLQAALQYTTDCQEYEGDYMDVEDLIYGCVNNERCVNGNETCKVLNNTLPDMLKKTWPSGKDWPTKGYEIFITSESDGEENKIYRFEKGSKVNATIIKGSSQDLPPKSGTGKIKVSFTVYEKN